MVFETLFSSGQVLTPKDYTDQVIWESCTALLKPEVLRGVSYSCVWESYSFFVLPFSVPTLSPESLPSVLGWTPQHTQSVCAPGNPQALQWWHAMWSGHISGKKNFFPNTYKGPLGIKENSLTQQFHYPRKIKVYVHRLLCTREFIVAGHTQIYINRKQYIHTIEHYSEIKRKNKLQTWINLRDIRFTKRSQTQEYILYDST